MGNYLNPGSDAFRMALNSEIFVDKSMLIGSVNRHILTMQRFICISRPRRFGKSMAVDMLSAYYDCGEDTTALFDRLAVNSSPSFSKHINKYDVIKINMQEFLSAAPDVNEMLSLMSKRIVSELRKSYPDHVESDNLSFAMKDVYSATRRPFIILIDEWDCMFREYKYNTYAQKKYLDFLRAWLKDQTYVALAYMTGILPIKKYGSHSALNMFSEYSMMDSGEMSEFFGFTENEVQALCISYKMDFDEAKNWYDGYSFSLPDINGNRNISVYSPKSVVDAMLRRRFGNYWNSTETYEALKIYIQMDMDGLKDAVVEMLGGSSININTGTFSNDMTTFTTRDDVLSLLVHLGYLTYCSDEGSVSIPNREVSQEYVNAISTMDWKEVISSIYDSRKLLEALWSLDNKAVAAGIEKVHKEVSILKYNDENSLSCIIMLAFYTAREYYTIIREMPAGKGFADICMIPRKAHQDKPAAIIELKWNMDAYGAIRQIKDRNYTDALKEYRGSLILAGISYSPRTKQHTCEIEKI